jgi:hypothetical protein
LLDQEAISENLLLPYNNLPIPEKIGSVPRTSLASWMFPKRINWLIDSGFKIQYSGKTRLFRPEKRLAL